MKAWERTNLALGGLALGAVLFLAVNVLSGGLLGGLRLDLTEDRLYTISDGTRQVLKAIDEPVTVRLYFSKNLGDRSPPHATYHTRVRELLAQYAEIAGGKLRVEHYDPEPFSPAEDRAVAFGLQGIPVTGAGDLGYFGLAATNATDDHAVIPFFNLERENFIEYDLTKALYTLAHPAKPVVGLLSTLPIEGGRGAMGATPPWVVLKSLEDLFEIRPVEPDVDRIPDGIEVLMIVQPKDLGPRTLYAIDQYVLGGGRAVVFVDPNAETEGLSAPALPDMDGGVAGFNTLLEAWGVRLVDGKVAGDLHAARRVNATQGGRAVITDYVAWLKLESANFDTDDVVTADVKTLNLATAGVLETVEGATTTVHPLLTTGPASMRIDAAQFKMGPDPVTLYQDFTPSGQRETLAVRITGPAKTAFPDGRPAGKDAKEGGDDAEAAPPPPLAESTEPLNVLVVADTDLLYDRFWVAQRDFFGQEVLLPYADNADFVVNALDNLTGSGALISLRGRGRTDRPFTLVEDIRRDAERHYRAKEEELRTKLSEVEKKLDALQGGGGGAEGGAGAAILSPEEKRALEDFRGQMVAIRGELRDVQHALRGDIERLDGWLKFLNIAGIPLLLGAGLLTAMVIRRVRRRAV